jgi:type II restriction enzyme
MDLSCSLELAANYQSNAQIARVVTENWFASQMYCPACTSESLTPERNNCPGIDFRCPTCSLVYQLKSRKTALTNRVVDAGYSAMIRAIRSEQVPNLFLLQYSPSWSVLNLVLIPSFFLTGQQLRSGDPFRRAPGGLIGWDAIFSSTIFPSMGG